MERSNAYIAGVLTYKNFVQKTYDRMSRDRKKGSSTQLVVVRLQSVSVVRCVCVCVRDLWASGESRVRAVGTVMTLVIWSEVLEFCCLCISTCHS
jgi:hypothetical protein